MDWKTIISDLRAAGLTQSEIAQEAGTSQGHISDIANGKKGKHLSFEIGAKLLALHAQHRAAAEHPEAA